MANTALKSADSAVLPAQRSSEASPHARFAWAMRTHPGRVRHANQDACAAAPDHAAFVVCDGVGGAAGGEVASQLAAESFLNALRSSLDKNNARVSGAPSRLRLGGSEESGSSPHARLHHAVLAANSTVFERAQRTRSLRGMATTLVAALLEYPDEKSGAPSTRSLGGRESCPTLWLAHAGDSRAYRLRAGAISQLTRDHSLVEEQLRAGLLSPFDAARSPVRNVITRAVGSMPTVEPEIASHAIEPGDLYLLASDGLTRELEDDAIAHILATHLADRTSSALEAAAQSLIEAANHHGGRDNITVLLLACR